MIDTLGVRYRMGDGPVREAELKAMMASCPGGLQEIANTVADARSVQEWRGENARVGRMVLRADGSVFATRSLSKVYQSLAENCPVEAQDNGRLLSSTQAADGWQMWEDEICKALPVDRESCEVRRADLVYDRRVQSASAVFKALEAAIKPTRKGCTSFVDRAGSFTGLFLSGKKVAHRVYDKGLESGSALYRGVVRSEEQLRAGAVNLKKLLLLDQRAFDREAGVEIMNDRYIGMVGGEAEIDLEALMEKKQYQVALLAVRPDLIGVLRDRMTRQSFNEVRRRVRAVRAAVVPVALRVPDDAWLLGFDEEPCAAALQGAG